MGKCKICGEDYYHQTQTDPEEPCWCGEMATRIYNFGDRVKQMRYKLASIILKFAEWSADKLTKRDV